MHAREMISTHPNVRGQADDALIRCIEECYACAQTCAACADACLGEETVRDLVQCIRLNLDCADLCYTAGVIASRRSGGNEPVIGRTLEACAEACARCAAECARHAERMEHCRVCAEQCRRCEDACRAGVVSVGGGVPRPSTPH
jgi:hypothetical protein